MRQKRPLTLALLAVTGLLMAFQNCSRVLPDNFHDNENFSSSITPPIPSPDPTSAPSPVPSAAPSSTPAPSSPAPTPSSGNCTESANDSVVTSVGPTICDAFGNNWAISNSATLTKNGNYVRNSADVIEIAYVNGVVWQENSSDNWYSFSSGSWTQGPSPLPSGPSPTPSQSPSANILYPGSSGTLTDSSGNVYSIDASGNIYENGQLVPGGSDTAAIAVVNGSFYGQDSASGNWYLWNGTNFILQGALP